MDDITFLLSCSDNNRDAFMLAKLDLAARLRKEVGQLLDKWIEAEAHAMLGDILRETKYTPVTIDSGPARSITDILSTARRQLKQPG